MRRAQVPASTTDQRLLDSGGPSDWVHTDTWRVMRIQAEFVEGFGALAELGPAISVFGSARSQPGHPDYDKGIQLGGALAEAGFAVITGGGPGAMEAANKGASQAGGVSVGLGIELPFESGPQRVGRHRHQLPLLLRPQDDVRQVRPGIHRAARRLRHLRRDLRGDHAGADAQGHLVPDRAARHRRTGAGSCSGSGTRCSPTARSTSRTSSCSHVTDDVDEAVAIMVEPRPTSQSTAPTERGCEETTRAELRGRSSR